jgi:hypothetical protein
MSIQLAKKIKEAGTLEEARALADELLEEITPERSLRIVFDEDPMNPRKEFDNFGKMVCWHGRYNLGDEQPNCEPSEYEIPKGALVLPLYLYDHSGITISTGKFSCPWDSGQVGFIFATKEQIKAEFKGSRKKAQACLEAEVALYDDYLTGQVYGFIFEDGEGNDDSCFGFYGDSAKEAIMEHLPESARDLLEDAWDKRGESR